MLNDENTQIVIRKTNLDGIGNVLKAFISAKSIHNDVVLHCNPNFIYGHYDTILDNKYIYYEKNNTKHIEDFYTCRLLVLKSEEQYQEHLPTCCNYSDGCQNSKLNYLFSLTTLIDWNYNSQKLCKQLKTRIFNVIDHLVFKDIIIDELNKMKTLIINGKNENLAISVRTWKSSHENNINRPYNFETYQNTIVNVLKNNNISNVVLSIDNEEYLQNYIDLLEKYKDINLIVLKKNKLNDTQFAMFKVLILSKCDFLIANRISTFSELIFWFSKCKIHVFPLF
jgi:hypothetical protein